LKFHQKVVKEELSWATMGDISSTLRAEAQNAEAAREYSRKTGALVSALNDKFDQERTGKLE